MWGLPLLCTFSTNSKKGPILKKIYSSFFPLPSDPWLKVTGVNGRPETLFGSMYNNDDKSSLMKSHFGSPQWMGSASTILTDLAPKLLIKCTLNNIFLELSGEKGRPIWAISAGCLGFKNAQKTTNKTALAMMDALWLKLSQLSISKIRVDFRGVNPARQILLSQLRRPGLEIAEIMDTTPKPFNGPRPKKARRI
ncbi:hypothetical protein MDAP_002779 [Mitosporidium daphniae]|uniref:Mitochondrial 28S ribosomal protein S11 n=1 Tax=Mitosporidium daphniae TaxID=1485682 RepID=A0A098VT60_9MICR|nr:mitochondrial 28S ribosomal protein S11 [Mitosporidium daphniae]KGG52170.1 mitochondrial 28S ribosomal protein S11 [Mitosporidium daphniae]|eukprot:XP_013238597.1 mitochondrial 28S ribosomal protein S11 [Mitosporidium daphniae]